jgi:hypothetical protein
MRYRRKLVESQAAERNCLLKVLRVRQKVIPLPARVSLIGGILSSHRLGTFKQSPTTDACITD